VPARRSGSERSPVSTAFVQHHALLKKLVARYFSSRHDVEDVLQEAYLRAYEAETKRVVEHPTAFLLQVAKNVALTNLAKKSRQRTDYIEDVGDSIDFGVEAAVDQELAAHERLGLYCEAISTLSEKCRGVFWLRKVYGLSHAEIAVRMALSVSSVEKYLHEAVLTCDAHVRKHEKPMGTGE
jgi:RNA polymerase sigma-70 factor (ECF subfamily)